ncbi:ABC transporter ATP-binding protein [Sporosarcina saromensis]|uniref:Quaternary amine transport ATP-binding protein n=1 Tax=Sporosarcina saromensis TaxID=359365 RepID=A0ABU4G9P5_9BACL|nr:ABC transporter ATP-binding protein [Sporosarcina saromensis]MDW0113065.1 ABC transporter ATP-binding protein [Sporosarcina saromensis]
MITFESVSKKYSDGFEALKQLNFTIRQGELFVLIGPSGSGKTTTMKMINRLIEPTGGTIKIQDKDISTVNPVTLRREIGYVIQQIGLLPHMTIRENVGLVPQLKKMPEANYRDRVEELMHMVGLEPDVFGDRYPKELSGGQQQRIGVIRAMAAEPDIILMDEPFSALDPISREQLQDELMRLQREVKKTIVFVTHDMDEALKIADRVCIMKDGEIVQIDTPENIIRRPANEFVKNFIGENRLADSMTLPSLESLLIPAITASPKRGLAEALKLMQKRRVDSLVIVDEQKKYLGITTIWDLQKSFNDEKLTLQDIQRTDIPTYYVDQPAEEVFKAITESNYWFIPVIDRDDQLLGLVTRSSVVQFVVNELI